MTLSREDITGWGGSIVIHLLLALILFFWQIKNLTAEAEFIEVTFGTIAPIVKPANPQPSTSSSAGSSIASTVTSSRLLDLPERRMLSQNEDILTIPEQRKIAADDHSPNMKIKISEGGSGDKERGVGSSVGERELSRQPESGGESINVGGPGTPGTMGTDISNAVSYSMTWSDGGTRKKLSGNLPSYPEGANVEAQIKIEAVVQPDGSVKFVKPLQKGNTRLEESAMKEVRIWRFEPLRKSLPQREQNCLITFNFKLR